MKKKLLTLLMVMCILTTLNHHVPVLANEENATVGLNNHAGFIETLWGNNIAEVAADSISYELGTKFQTTVNGYARAIRLFVVEGESGLHIARIWDNSTNKVVGGPYTINFYGLRGWCSYELPVPVKLKAKTNYTISVSTGTDANKSYAKIENILKIGGNNQKHLSYDKGAGVYSTTLGSCPNKVKDNTNYFRDIEFMPEVYDGKRDPWLWPFAQDSIWNTPIGSNARYSPAGFGEELMYNIDEEPLFKLDKKYPTRPIYIPFSWELRAKGTNDPQGFMEIPDDFYMPDATSDSTPNYCSAFLQRDGRTIVQLNPLTRVEKAGPVYGWRAPDQDIYGQGLYGGHGGSLLSSIGGSIRKGELIGNEPIKHALKINVWGGKYLHYDKKSKTPGYVWPAARADSGADEIYGGVNPKVTMGSLVAIPRSLNPEDLGITKEPIKKIFKALQDYGAYIVDDTYWSCFAIDAEMGVDQEVNDKYGYGFSSATWDKQDGMYDEMTKLLKAIYVVENNTPNNKGGGGVPVAPLAPVFKENPVIDKTAPSWDRSKVVKVITKTVNSVKIEWPKAKDNVKVTGYNIYEDGKWIAWTHTQTSKNITELMVGSNPLKPNTTYTFTVKAVDLAGNESQPTTPLKVKTLPDTTPPTIPTGLTAKYFDDTSVDLKWSASDDDVGVASYSIYNGTKLVGSTSGETTEFTLEGLKAKAQCSLSVKAKDATGNESKGSSALKIVTEGTPLYKENFSSGEANGWDMEYGTTQNKELELSDWDIHYASAIYQNLILNKSYTYSVVASSEGEDVGNKIMLFFNYKDKENTYYLEISGGTKALLKKVINGVESTIATYSDGEDSDFTGKLWYHINYKEGGIITIKVVNDTKTIVLFNEIKDTSFSTGMIGVGMKDNVAVFDNIKIVLQ